MVVALFTAKILVVVVVAVVKSLINPLVNVSPIPEMFVVDAFVSHALVE